MNDRLSVAMARGPNFKAVEDAKKMQAAIVAQCAEAGRELPPYVLSELIGKGSFGRVYKAVDTRSGGRGGNQTVAVKIINIEEGDMQGPGGAAVDTFGDILKEVNALKLLNASGARNVNVVLDSLLVGPSVWIVTEHCAGGSVATLMRPTGFLIEKWIVPILREVAEALFWVHRQGIIHRDIKCANVLVTAAGGVQLCDFGVAGIVESKFDKRKTVTGTLHWMAPELFNASVAYGAEVDIWAFGAMAYEVASGLPPNATMHIDPMAFGSYLGQHSPRLEGDRYSPQLKDLVAFCLVPDPTQRPSIDAIQRHPYIFNTASRYPVESLRTLLSAYHMWQARGGGRLSLFSAGGAQGVDSLDPVAQQRSPDWDFDDNSDEGELFQPDGTPDSQAVYEAYGLPFDSQKENTSTTARQPSSTNLRRRRMPPAGMPRRQYPLEKLFEPGTLASYPDIARAVYGRPEIPPPPPSDLPLRRDSDDDAARTVRESLIDLDASLVPDMETTIRAPRRSSVNVDLDMARRRTQDWTFPNAPLSAAAAGEVPHDWPLVSQDSQYAAAQNQQGDRRKTQDWTFPEIRLPPEYMPADPSRLVGSRPPVGSRPALGAGGLLSAAAAVNRQSTVSLIDLDESIVENDYGQPPPTSAHSEDVSDAASESEDPPFGLERLRLGRRRQASMASTLNGRFASVDHGREREPSLYVPEGLGSVKEREPSLYVPDGLGYPVVEVTKPVEPIQPANAVDATAAPTQTTQVQQTDEDTASQAGDSVAAPDGSASALALPPTPRIPSSKVLGGNASRETIKDELLRLLGSLGDHLQVSGHTIERLPARAQG